MKLKTVEIEGKQYAEISDGKPVYVDNDGKDHTYDAPAMRGSLDKLNGALATEREEKGKLESRLQAFEGIDPAAAQKALKTVKNLDDKKLIDAGEVERVKQETAQAFQERLNKAEADNEALRNEVATDKMTAAFSSSKFVKEKLAVPADMVQSTFSRNFQFKDGRITPLDGNGQPIYSRANPGDIANFDEALEIIVDRYPYKDSILKGSGQAGSGADSPDGVGGRKITRKQFESMRPDEQQKFASSAAKGEVTITD